MDIQATKLELMQLVLNTQKEKVLQQIKDILDNENELSIKQYNKDIEDADKEVDAGIFFTQQEVENMEP